MGSTQSTHTTTEIRELPEKQEAPLSSVRGRKQSNADNVLVVEHPLISIKAEESDDSSVDASTDGLVSDVDESIDDSDNEGLTERDQILEDALGLGKFATFYLQPEKAIAVDGTACARCFFNRPAAPMQFLEEEEKEKFLILSEAKSLKKLAVDYLHPEKPVVVDPLAFGRNYFLRDSAPAQEETDRAAILADAQALKALAVDYMHPEKSVTVSDPCCMGRNYFDRASAPNNEEEDERARILADMEAMKKLANDYLHPERPVATTDPHAKGRNYFSRPSAASFDDEGEVREREQILEDARLLKALAVDYLHPENPVVTSDPCATGRNYFSRPSALEYEDEDEMDEREEILEDMARLKSLAVDYLHPERHVVVDPLSSCRNYFDRPSASLPESSEEAAHREQALADAAALKRLAVDYLHPEKPVEVTDGFAMGRNYFSRPSAERYDEEDEADERAQVMADMVGLKKLAEDYHYPERPVVPTDANALGRNYFSRYSAEEQEEDVEGREAVLSDCAALKKLAVDYLHPEKPVVVDPLAFGRNYFLRDSAPEQLDSDSVAEEALILEDAQELKQKAVDYQYPELPLKSQDSTATGRNYFNRASAPGHAEQIHSEGYAIPKMTYTSGVETYRDDGYYHHYDITDYSDDSYRRQSDHFEMDEDVSHSFQEFRQSLATMVPLKGAEAPKESDEGEGKLSRSPSSVMLFEEAAL